MARVGQVLTHVTSTFRQQLPPSKAIYDRSAGSGYERDMTAARLRKAEKKLSQLLAEEPSQD